MEPTPCDALYSFSHLRAEQQCKTAPSTLKARGRHSPILRAPIISHTSFRNLSLSHWRVSIRSAAGYHDHAHERATQQYQDVENLADHPRFEPGDPSNARRARSASPSLCTVAERRTTTELILGFVALHDKRNMAPSSWPLPVCTL